MNNNIINNYSNTRTDNKKKFFSGYNRVSVTSMTDCASRTRCFLCNNLSCCMMLQQECKDLVHLDWDKVYRLLKTGYSWQDVCEYDRYLSNNNVSFIKKEFFIVMDDVINDSNYKNQVNRSM